jgi:hypothetical protein
MERCSRSRYPIDHLRHGTKSLHDSLTESGVSLSVIPEMSDELALIFALC